MAARRYDGPVHTLEQARFADLAVRIVCKACGHFRQMHAFEVIRKARGKVQAGNLPLNTPLAGIFYCRRCRARVPVTLEAPA